MNKAKKIFSAALSAVVGVTALSTMAVSVFAAGETLDIRIAEGNENAEYYAYRLLDLTTSQRPNGDINYAYTLNDKFDDVLMQLTGQDNERDVVSYLGELTDTEIRDFGDDIFLELRDNETYSGILESPDYQAVDDVFSDVQQGYYLITEVEEIGGEYVARTFTLLDTAEQYAEDGVLVINAKTDVPTVEKKIFEDEDETYTAGGLSGWNDVADYDINDDVMFQISGTMPDVLDDYDVYRYVFHDSLDAGLTFNADSVEVKVGDSVIDSFCYDVEVGQCDADHDAFDGACTFTIGFDDVKSLTSKGTPVTVDENSVISVTYDATLNEDAVCGNPGNENDVYLEFSNDPYVLGDGWDEPGSTGNTPIDTVVCFTYAVHVDKINEWDEQLTDVHFRLYADADCTQEIGLTQDSSDPSIYYVNGTNTGDEIVVTQPTGILIKGLEADEGSVDGTGAITTGGTTYYLVETQAPDGYHALINPVVLSVAGDYDHRSDYTDPPNTVALANLYANASVEGDTIKNLGVDISTGSVNDVTFSVVNTTSEELPMTGDTSALALTIAGTTILVLALGGLGGYSIYRRKKDAK